MKTFIYEPAGRAREYSPLALNLYRGCDHRCRYCYAKRLGQGDTPIPRDGLLAGLARELVRPPDKQVLLSFMGDPYCMSDIGHQTTREVVKLLTRTGTPTAILTKGGTRSLRDLDLFIGQNIKIGATLTFWSPDKSLAEEPGAALPKDRISALKALHDAGVMTWANIEPVIEPLESLEVLSHALPYLTQVKVGKLNHDARARSTDWARFARSAVDLIRSHSSVSFYIKHDLRPFLPDGYITPEEADPDYMSLCRHVPVTQGELY